MKRSIDEQGKLTDELAAAIDVGKAESLPVNYLEGVAEQLDV